MYEFDDLDQFLSEFGIGVELLTLILGIGLVFLLIYGIFALVCYIFQSVGLYGIATRRGIKNPWLAWIPYGKYWIAGTISDQYRYVAKGQVKNNRIILLVLVAVSVGLNLIVQGISGNSMESVLELLMSGDMGEIPGQTGAEVGIGAGISSLLSLIGNAVAIALFVFWHISLYDLYSSCNPKNAVLFTVLGILFGVTVPFFIFACRKKDEGMPPRRDATVVEPQQPTWQPVQPQNVEWQPAPEQDPWENTHQ